jgi:hypothetical protein
VSLVANITYDSIDLVLIKFNTSFLKGISVGLLPGRIFRLLELSLLRRLYIVKERHETVVHVQLLVAVKKGQPRIISNEVHLGFLVAA